MAPDKVNSDHVKVTRRSTFHTDKEETAISAPPLQQSGYDGDRSYEISSQDR